MVIVTAGWDRVSIGSLVFYTSIDLRHGSDCHRIDTSQFPVVIVTYRLHVHNNISKRDCEKMKRRCETAKGRCETTKGWCETTGLQNNKTAKQRKGDAKLRKGEAKERDFKQWKCEMALSGHHKKATRNGSKFVSAAFKRWPRYNNHRTNTMRYLFWLLSNICIIILHLS